MVYRQTTRSEKVRASSRKRILRAARKLFASRGYPATTMRDVADSANTSIGNLYFYFKNKEELLRSLFWEAREPVWTWIDTAVAQLPPGAGPMAVAVYANMLRLFREDSDLMRLFILEGAPQSITTQSTREHMAHWRVLWQKNFPDFPSDDLELAISAWTGALRRAVDRWVFGELTASPVEIAEFVTRWNLKALGVSASEIDAAIKAAENAIETFPGKA